MRISDWSSDVCSSDLAANREMADQVIKMCGELGMEHVIDIELPVSVTDLRPTVLKLKQAGDIDVLYHTGHDVHLVKLVQECAALGFNPKAILGGYLTTEIGRASCRARVCQYW